MGLCHFWRRNKTSMALKGSCHNLAFTVILLCPGYERGERVRSLLWRCDAQGDGERSEDHAKRRPLHAKLFITCRYVSECRSVDWFWLVARIMVASWQTVSQTLARVPFRFKCWLLYGSKHSGCQSWRLPPMPAEVYPGQCVHLCHPLHGSLSSAQQNFLWSCEAVCCQCTVEHQFAETGLSETSILRTSRQNERKRCK